MPGYTRSTKSSDICATYSIKETAQILGVGINKAYDLARTGKIPVLELDGVKRVPKAKLNEMVGA